MMKITNRTGKTLHLVIRKEDIQNQTSERIDHTSIDEDIQVTTIFAKKNRTWKPHIHIERLYPKEKQKVQECFLVMNGTLLARYYDEDKNLIDEMLLNEGDCSITLAGGHSYDVLSDNCLVYEFKTGPYRGLKNDKMLI